MSRWKLAYQEVVCYSSDFIIGFMSLTANDNTDYCSKCLTYAITNNYMLLPYTMALQVTDNYNT